MQPEWCDLDGAFVRMILRTEFSGAPPVLFAEGPLEEGVDEEVTGQNGNRYKYCERHNKVMMRLDDSGSPEQFVSNL